MHINTKSNAARIPFGKFGGYVGGKLLFLPGEALQTVSRENLKAAVTTNCKKSDEAIVSFSPKKRGRAEQS